MFAYFIANTSRYDSWKEKDGERTIPAVGNYTIGIIYYIVLLITSRFIFLNGSPLSIIFIGKPAFVFVAFFMLQNKTIKLSKVEIVQKSILLKNLITFLGEQLFEESISSATMKCQ